MNEPVIVQRYMTVDWSKRIEELKADNVCGAVFYTDGGMRRVRGVDQSGYGIHAYFFNDAKAEGLGGFKLDHPTARGYQVKKTVKKEDAVNVVRFLNAGGNNSLTTNQVAELEAFIQACSLFINSGMIEFCKTLSIFSDSEYLTKGINDHMQGWVRNGWRKSDGKQVKNLVYWKQIHQLVEAIEATDCILHVDWVEGHAFNTGNVIADQMATLGLFQCETWFDEWLERNEYLASAIAFSPLLIESKLLYYPTKSNRSKLDNKWYHWIYNNNNNQDEVNEIGRKLLDASIGIVITDERQEYIHQLYDSCEVLDDLISGTPKVIDLSVATKPNVVIELTKDNIIHAELEVTKRDIKLKTTADKVAITVLDPPRNSLTTAKNIEELLNVYQRYLDGLDEDILSVEITDHLFDKEVNGKGVTKLKFKVMEDPVITVNAPFWRSNGETRHFNVPLTFGLDLPRRRVFSNIKDLNPQAWLITWFENDYMSYCATIVKIDGAIGIWQAEQANAVKTALLEELGNGCISD